MEGYGLYWFCIELVAMNVTSTKLTFELEHDARLIARMTGMPVSKVETVMKDFVSLDLFSASEGRIQCLKLAKRCDDFTAKALRTNGLQAIEIKQVRQSPTNSDKVPLEDRSKKVEDRIEDKETSRFPRAKNNQPPVPYNEIVEVYKQILVPIGMTDIIKLTDKRKDKIRVFWRQMDMNIDKWRSYCIDISMKCKWFGVRRPKNDGSGQHWNPRDLMFIAKAETMNDVAVGKYND